MKKHQLSVKRYPAYKDSGDEWLGKVPEEWSIVRNKKIFKERSSLSTTGKETLLTVSHITGVTPRSEKNVNMFMADTMEGYKICHQGDLIINTMWAWMGALGTSNELGICSPSYNVYMPIKGVPYHHRYFDYLFRTPNAIVEMTRNSKGIVSSRLRLYAKDFFQIETVLPSLEEQKTIAHYLDTKTAQIDRKITLLTQKATLYGKLKQSLINETVTRGLDRSVPMKDSGIEAIGKVPEHWEIRRVKSVGINNLTNGIFKKKEDFGFGVKLINVSDLYQADNIVKHECLDRVNANEEEMNRYQVIEGDIFFVRSSLKVEGIGISALIERVEEATVFECHVIRFRPNLKFAYPKFLKYLFHSENIKFKFIIVSKTVTMTTISQDKISSTELVVPPLPEQKAIAHYLDTKTTQIDQIIQTLNTQIEKLKELRKTLINDVVTGKIKVVDIDQSPQ